MRPRICITLISLFYATFAMQAFASVTGAKDLPNGMQFTVDDGTLRVQFWSDSIARVTYAKGKELPEINSVSVVAPPAAVKWTKQESDRAILLVGSQFKVSVDKQSGAVAFLDLKDNVLLRESAEGRKIAAATQAGVQGDSCSQTFDLPADEGLYGLGQHQQGVWNYRAGGPQGAGVTVRLAQSNTNVGVPVITSTKGYMLLWDNPAVTTISAGAAATTSDAAGDNAPRGRRGRGGGQPPGAGAEVVRWTSEYGPAIDYYFCYGDGSAGAAMKAYRHLTGDAPLMPQWMLGFWQCKERYASAKGIARRGQANIAR